MPAGRPPKYPVNLSQNDIVRLEAIQSANPSKTVLERCGVLRGLNNCEPGKLNFTQVASAHCKGKNFSSSVAKRYSEGGVEAIATIGRSPNSNTARLKMGAREEAHLTAIACSPPPSPYTRWTVQLCTAELNKRLAAMGMESDFSGSTVWRALSRNELHPHLSEYWCIPEVSAEFIMRMEKVLHIYSLPYDKDYPVVCLDEAALQLLRDYKNRLEVAPGFAEKIDADYIREGTKNIFVAVEPKVGRYYVRATDSRAATDWAVEVKNLTLLYPEAKKIILVMDNLNTHSIESLYKAFPPEEAKAIADRITIVYAPVHASWLDMAEIGINVMKRECIGKRFRTKEDVVNLPARLESWQEQKNANPKAYNWTFTVEKARKHDHLYNREILSASSAAKYSQQNALCPAVPAEYATQGPLLVVTAPKEEEGEIIDLCRSVDENGNECWVISLEEKRVALREPVGKKQVAPLVGQRNTHDGWLIPFPSKPRALKEGKKEREVSYDYGFMAWGEDVIDVYNTPYDEKYPVVCISKRPFDLENPSGNAWVGNLCSDHKSSKKRNETAQEREESVDNRLGILFVYAPHTGQKAFRLSDWTDDLVFGETLLDISNKMYPEAKCIHLVLDKEDVTKISTLYQVCSDADAALNTHIKFAPHAVPDSGRWLNFAENEAITVCRQCLVAGVSTVDQLAEHLSNWQRKRTFVDMKLNIDRFRSIFSGVYRPIHGLSP